MELREQADYYRTHPPRCIASFITAPAELPDFPFDGHLAPSAIKAPEEMIDGPELLNPIFLLKCTCGRDRHHVMGYHWRNPDFSNILVFLSPIALRCASCGKETEVIDTDRHGYDAEQGGTVGTARGEGDRGEYRCDQCGPRAFEVWVRFEYPDDLLKRPSKGFRGREQDLFSWFTLVGKCPACSRLMAVADFECA